MYKSKFTPGTDYKASFKEAVAELIKQKMPPAWRIKAVDDLCEAYIMQTGGEYPDSTQLIILANYILHDNLSDRSPDKVTNTEYPILSEGQIKVRNNRELPRPDFNYYSYGKTFPKRATQKNRGWAGFKSM